MGNGRFSQKLTDEQWKDFNNYQRAHYNYVEGVASAITLNLISGLFFPVYSGVLGAAYIVGRFLYAYGYIKYGPKGRGSGATILDIALVVMLGMSIYGPVQLLLK